MGCGAVPRDPGSSEFRATTCETREKQEQSVYLQSRDNKYWAETNETCAQYYMTNTIREPAAAGAADIAAGAFAEAARTASACR